MYSGTFTISTVEQLELKTPGMPESGSCVAPGEVSDSVRVGTGFGDGGVDLLALVEANGAVCGFIVGMSLRRTPGWSPSSPASVSPR